MKLQPPHIVHVLGGASRAASQTLEESFHMPMTAKKRKTKKAKKAKVAKKAKKRRKAKK